MRVKWNGMHMQTYEGKSVYAIDVTEIIEIKNWRS